MTDSYNEVTALVLAVFKMFILNVSLKKNYCVLTKPNFFVSSRITSI